MRLSESRRMSYVGGVVWIVWSLGFTQVPASVAAEALDRQPADDEVSYRPEDGSTVAANPPAFVWLPARGVERYIVQYSSSEDFGPEAVEGRLISYRGVTLHPAVRS